MGKINKFVGAACTATGMVAISGLVASGAAVYSVAEGFKTAGRIMKNALKEEKKEETIPENESGNLSDHDTEMAAVSN